MLHTLVVDPTIAGHGYGTQFVRFYARRARALGCTVLRIDTNAKNAAARRLYARLGFREAAIVPCTFNGIAGVELVCLEKRLDAACHKANKPQPVDTYHGLRFFYKTRYWRSNSTRCAPIRRLSCAPVCLPRVRR